MNWMKLKIWLVLLCTVLIGCSFALDVLGIVRPPELVASSEGVPILVKRKNDLLCTGISQIEADEEQIYILFGTYGVVQVYTTEGQYLYSVSVYNHNNGRTEIMAKNGSLYIRDKHHNIYIISDGEFLEFIANDDADSIGKSRKFGVSDPNYTLKGSSVWRVSDDTCVLKRPDWLVIYQGNINWLIKFLLMITVGIILYFPVPKKKQEIKL